MNAVLERLWNIDPVLKGLYVALAVITVIFAVAWARVARQRLTAPAERIGLGFFANFFDALGIGSFATTTTYFRLRKMVRDEEIPGTLNVGHCLPTITQAFISISVIEVDVVTLVLMIATAVAGSWFGAGVVAKLPRRAIQIGMGLALLIAAGFMYAKVTGSMPTKDAGTLGLTGGTLILGLIGSFFLGSIMPLGIGYYAPCMILTTMLGMNPKVSWPIMTGACAFLMPVASIRFVQKRKYNLRAAIGLALGGIFGSALALLVVKEMDLEKVMWLVTVVVLYTGGSLLWSATRESKTPARVA